MTSFVLFCASVSFFFRF